MSERVEIKCYDWFCWNGKHLPNNFPLKNVVNSCGFPLKNRASVTENMFFTE